MEDARTRTETEALASCKLRYFSIIEIERHVQVLMFVPDPVLCVLVSGLFLHTPRHSGNLY